MLRAKWIYELPELDSLKGEKPRVRGVYRLIIDNYRASLGAAPRLQRQCVFIGTTNESE